MPTKKEPFDNKKVTLSEAKSLVKQAPVLKAVEFEIPEGLIPVGDVKFDTMNDVVASRTKAREAWLMLKKEQERIDNLRKDLAKVQPQATVDYNGAWNKLAAMPGLGYLEVLFKNRSAVRKTEFEAWDEKVKDALVAQNKNYAKYLELKEEIAIAQQWVNDNAGTWKVLYDEAELTCNELAEAMNDESLRYDNLFPKKSKAGATA
jgi:hypothetical protein